MELNLSGLLLFFPASVSEGQKLVDSFRCTFLKKKRGPLPESQSSLLGFLDPEWCVSGGGKKLNSITCHFTHFLFSIFLKYFSILSAYLYPQSTAMEASVSCRSQKERRKREKERKRERKNKATLPSTLEVLVIPVVLIRPVILQMKRLPFILILQKKLLPYRIGNQADPHIQAHSNAHAHIHTHTHTHTHTGYY